MNSKTKKFITGGALALLAFTSLAAAQDTVTCSDRPVSSTLTQAEKDTMLRLHNQERTLVGNAPLVWDNTLANFAQGWADVIARNNKANTTVPVAAWPHSQGSCYAKNNGGTGYGENISSGGITADAAFSLWNNEKPKYDVASRKCVNGECGHYIAVIARQSTKVGCGHNANSSWICSYDPIGPRRMADGSYQQLLSSQLPRITTPYSSTLTAASMSDRLDAVFPVTANKQYTITISEKSKTAPVQVSVKDQSGNQVTLTSSGSSKQNITAFPGQSVVGTFTAPASGTYSLQTVPFGALTYDLQVR